MPIPLGIFAVAGAGGGALPAYEQISTQILGSTTASVTFSSIPNTYKHLQIRMTHRLDSTGVNNMIVRLNGNSSNVYAYHFLRGFSGAVSSGASTSATGAHLQTTAMTSAGPANAFAAGILDILDYASTTKNKTILSINGKLDPSNNPTIVLTSGLWANTAAITSITIQPDGASMVSGSRFSLYGIKG
jgi:hypothetical protein